MAYTMKEHMEMAEEIYNAQTENTEFAGNENWRVLEVCDDEAIGHSGMYACLVDTGDGNCAIIFRGTNVHSPVDLIQDVVLADVGLLNNGETAQQAMAREFTKNMYEKYAGRFKEFTFIGHSLGGNLAEHAAITAPAGMKNNCNAVSLDGPGFSQKYMMEHAAEISAMKEGQLERYQWSFVGAFLNSLEGEKYANLRVHGVEDNRWKFNASDILGLAGFLADTIGYEFGKHTAYDRIKNGEYEEGRMTESDIKYVSRIFDMLTRIFTDHTLLGVFIKKFYEEYEKIWITDRNTSAGGAGKSNVSAGQSRADFHIQLQPVSDASESLKRIAAGMGDIQDNLLSVRQQMMPYQIFSRMNIMRLSYRLQEINLKCEKMGNAAREIANVYERSEQQCLNGAGMTRARAAGVPEGKQSEESAKEESTDNTAEETMSSVMSDDEILDEIQRRFDSFRGLRESWAGRCGALTYRQLESQGLVGDNDSTARGADYAKMLADRGVTETGYETTGYYCDRQTPEETFDKLLNDHNGSVNNVVVSFDHGEYGHAMLISKIENGKVYFMDNWRDYSDGNGGYVPQVISVDEYKQRYFSWSGYECNCMTVVGK